VWKYGFMPVPAPSRTPLYRVNDITFTEGTTTYGPEGNGGCRDTAAQLASSGVSRVLLVGHCHKDEAANGGLSLQRARKVKDCLVGHGLSADMFEVSSYGSAFSRADRTEPMKMEQERRVEIWVVSE
jgi:outer membrane protein OmpA-like peptidoglycan-associated protein